MKRISRMLGVTLLEIMLVLAIAAMVIVMSIRYYQSASISQKINSAINTITGIVAAGENYLNAKGTYSGISMSGLSVFLPGGGATSSPWGGLVSLSGAGAATYTIIMPNVPADACAQMNALLKTNNKVTIPASGCAAGITVKAY
jgi:Tfp pilus assembly protein PilE